MRIHELTFRTAVFLVAALALVMPADSAAQPVNHTASRIVEDGPTLALNVNRIKHHLAQSQAHEQSDSVFRLEYRLSVFGVAPPIDFLEDFDIEYGAVPFGAPMHTDFMNLWTPKGFRGPTIPLMPLIRWTFGR